jgi:hypothetical protein
MTFAKKKVIQIFSDGSINFSNNSFKKVNKIKVSKKDHATFVFNKKNANSSFTGSKDFESFKNRYLKF